MELITLFQDQPVRIILAAVLAYFLGCSNGAVIISKYILRDDVRTHGSGNAGLTNFHRTFGGGLTLVVILIDVVKAILAVWAGILLSGSLFSFLGGGTPLEPELQVTLYKYWSGAFCLLGHMFPCMFGFRGGKGILSGGTIAIMMDWRIALVVWGGFIILAAITKWVSLGSIWAGASFPFASWFVYQNVTILVMAILIGGLVVWKHRGNLVRILKGTESKFSLHHKTNGGA